LTEETKRNEGDGEDQTMNEPMKYMVVGALIAMVSGTAGGLLVRSSQNQRTEVGGQRSEVGSQRFTATPPRPMPHASSPSSGLTLPNRYTVPTPSPTLRQAQENPEVKRAYAEYLEVQRKYAAALQAAMDARGKQKSEVKGQRTEISGKKTEGSNQFSVISKQKTAK